MSAPNFSQSNISPTSAGWDGTVNSNAGILRTWLGEQPLCVKRFYRVSASNTLHPAVMNLVSFDPANYEGAIAFIRDPEVGETGLVFSDGTSWKYVASGTALTGIS